MIQILIGVIIAAALFCLLLTLYDTNRFVKAEYTVTSKKIKKPYTLVMISDLHNKSYGADNEKVILEIQKIHPDGVFIAGDMYTAEKGAGQDHALALLQKIRQHYPVYYANGNHETKTWLRKEIYQELYPRFVRQIKEMGVTHLVNEHVTLPAYGITVCGSQLDLEFYQRYKTLKMPENYLDKMLGQAVGDSFQILIAHNPDYFKDYAAWGADLVLSGHIHGGLIRVPFLGGLVSPAVKIFPKYDGGMFTEKEAVMVLGRGLGTHGIPIRIFNPAELVVVRLLPE